MTLVRGMLAEKHSDPMSNKAVEDLLHDLHAQIRLQSTKLIGALEKVEHYAKPTIKKLDEDFYAADDDEDQEQAV